MRKAILEALNLARRGVQNVVLELPTGYGKTVAGPYLYKAYREAGLCWRAIHVFPLRAILHKTLERYVQSHPEIEFTYQDGDVALRQRYVKDPYFRGEYVLTTLDSFVHNLLRAPVAELHKLLDRQPRAIHYHVPFAYIYPSCVFLDEAHIAVQDESGKATAALKASLEVLRDAEIPVVVMSATLGRWKRDFFRDFVFVELGEKEERSGEAVIVKDGEFEKLFEETRYVVEVIEESAVEAVARREAERGRRVLVIINNVSKVVELGKRLGAVVIHSALTREDREQAERKLGEARIVVGTSAIEAGVDVSFDVLITSADAAESVVQRVGRVCRYGGRCEGKLYLFGKDADVYLSVKEWRLPYREGSYRHLLRDKLEQDDGLYWLLKQITQVIHLSPQEIRQAYLRCGMSFVRNGLVEVCVDPSLRPEKCFTTSIERLSNLPIVAAVAEKCKLDPPRYEDPQDYVRWVIDAVGICGEVPKLLMEEGSYEPGYGPR